MIERVWDLPRFALGGDPETVRGLKSIVRWKRFRVVVEEANILPCLLEEGPHGLPSLVVVALHHGEQNAVGERKERNGEERGAVFSGGVSMGTGQGWSHVTRSSRRILQLLDSSAESVRSVQTEPPYPAAVKRSFVEEHMPHESRP